MSSTVLSECMSAKRPRRQAAQLALEKMRDIMEWEELPENSQRFMECAALIDSEFEAEVRHKSVLASKRGEYPRGPYCECAGCTM